MVNSVNKKSVPFIIISGNIGVGKSSLTSMLSESLNWQPILEAVTENPYLADFYTDMPRWSFHSQSYFLGRRVEQSKQVLDATRPVLQDRSIYEDAEIFAQNLYEEGHLPERDYQTFRRLYENICYFLPQPDLMIYLQAPVGKLAEQIAQRGRGYEQRIPIAYLADLNRLYDVWAAAWSLSPCITIDMSQRDFVRNRKDFQYILDQLPDDFVTFGS